MSLNLLQAFNGALLLCESLFCLVAALCFFWGKNYEPQTRKWMIWMQISAALQLLSDANACFFDGVPGRTGYWMVRITNFLVFFLLDVTLFFFQRYVNTCLLPIGEEHPLKRIKLAEAGCFLGMTLVVLSQFTGLYYGFDAENVYHRAAGFPISVLIPVSIMLTEASLLWEYRHQISRRLFLAVCSYIVLPLAGAMTQFLLFGSSMIDLMIGVSMLLMFLVSIREQNARLQQLETSRAQIAEKLEIATMLNRCVAKLSVGIDRNVALRGLMEVVRDYFQADRSYLFEIRQKTFLVNTYEAVKPGIAPQLDNLQEVPVEVIAHWMEHFRQENVYYMDDLEQEKNFASYEMLREQHVWRLLAVPLCRGKQIIGFLGLDNPRRHEQDSTLLSSIQFFITNSLEQRDQQLYLQNLSYSDTLTRLHNRNGYIERLNVWKKTKPERVGGIFIDLNGLKKTNDEQGHEAGDRLICRMAEILKEVFPQQAYRIGGDEFVVILPGIPEPEFDAKVQQLREALRRQQVSAAVGSVWEPAPEDVEVLLRRADDRMYCEKEKIKRA